MNEQLIRQVVAAIEAEPERWDQSIYLDVKDYDGKNPPNLAPCNTTMCFAGWTVAIKDGMQALWDMEYDGTGPDVAVLAKKYLGLTLHQAAELFYGGISDSLPEYKARIERVTGIKL